MNTAMIHRLRAALLGALLLGTLPAFAAEPTTTAHEHGAMPMPMSDDMEGHAMGSSPPPQAGTETMDMDMDMGAMRDGRAPPDARDPNAWADGYEYTGMDGFEQTDQLLFSKVLLDEFERVSGDEGEGLAWSLQAAIGGDRDKLWLRSQGLKIDEQPLDPTTDAEVLWWRAYAPFWGTVLGARQDFGAGAHTWLAVGVEGLTPYRFELEATGYVGEDGRLAARLKASRDLLFTNRLILTPGLEANVYSRANSDRGLGKGVGNLELGLRLRYEFHRKFAPYIGYVWERPFGDTVDLRRTEGEPVTERRFVVGVRLWW